MKGGTNQRNGNKDIDYDDYIKVENIIQNMNENKVGINKNKGEIQKNKDEINENKVGINENKDKIKKMEKVLNEYFESPKN